MGNSESINCDVDKQIVQDLQQITLNMSDNDD